MRHEFAPEGNSLVLVDESDSVTFESPQKFADLIDSKFCICFTATPSNCDERGIETEVITSLSFKQYKYVLNGPPTSVATLL